MSTQLTPEEVQRIAHLARMQVSADHLDKLTTDLASVLEFVDRLQAAKVDGLAPTSQVTGLTDVLRDDEVRPSSVDAAKLIAAAPEHEGRLIRVKRVLQ